MEKKVFYRIGAIIIGVIAILSLLMLSTKLPNSQKNGFTRNFLTKNLQTLQMAKVEAPLTKINGISENTIFLCGENPNAILMLNKRLDPIDTLMVNLKIPLEKLVPFSVKIDSPWLFIHFNNMKSVVHGKFPGQQLSITELKSPIFTKSVQISPNSCIIKTFNSSKKIQILQKIDTETGEIIKEAEIPIDMSSSDWLASDGMLEYNKHLDKLIYVEYLKNNFFCLDSNLTLIYKGKTIDTISSNITAMTKEIEKDGKAKMVPSEARIIVNKSCFIDDRYLYVASGLRSDNETLKEFNKNIVVDLYHIITGSYAGSFYIPHERNGSLRSAILNNDTLTALFDKKIITYRMSKVLFSDLEK